MAGKGEAALCGDTGKGDFLAVSWVAGATPGSHVPEKTRQGWGRIPWSQVFTTLLCMWQGKVFEPQVRIAVRTVKRSTLWDHETAGRIA